MVATVSPATLADLRRRGDKLTLIDVRTPAEYGEVHVDFAHNMPLDRLNPKDIAGLCGDADGEVLGRMELVPVTLICKMTRIEFDFFKITHCILLQALCLL
jgi:rhodanese-related sulfurtransferase